VQLEPLNIETGWLCHQAGGSMTNIRFDHFITYTSAEHIDDYVKEYAVQGFTPSETTVRHEPGLRNGFVFLGAEYIEFCWVEDEALFAAADAQDKALRAGRRPFGIGIVTDDVQALHEDWTARGYSVPDTVSKAPRDAPPDAPALWSFQDIPAELLPGVYSFALTYHARPRDAVKQVKIAPNSIYAIAGVTLVTPEPAARAACWRDLLAPGEPVTPTDIGFEVQIGPHLARWVTPAAYQAAYGLDWTPPPHPCGELALLHLLATDLSKAQAMLEAAGRRIDAISVAGHSELLVTPDERDGFAFLIRQQPAETWLEDRLRRTGEKLTLV
jgi:hypothetical protein